MNKLLIKKQAPYETLNVLPSSLLNILDPSRLKRRYRLLFERDNSIVASKFDNFVDLYDSTYGFDLLD